MRPIICVVPHMLHRSQELLDWVYSDALLQPSLGPLLLRQLVVTGHAAEPAADACGRPGGSSGDGSGGGLAEDVDVEQALRLRALPLSAGDLLLAGCLHGSSSEARQCAAEVVVAYVASCR